MKIILWRGYHSKKLLEILSEALEGKLLCILCPPHLKSYEFLNFMPKGSVECLGEWSNEEIHLVKKTESSRRHSDFPTLPHIGIFTSGTMSFTPNLILFTREQAEHSIQSILDLFKPSWAEKIICYPQPFHIFGLTLGYIHSILWKKPLLTPDGRYQKSFHDQWLKSDRKGLLTLGAPVHFYDLIQRSGQKLPTTQSSSICGGARVSPELWKSFQQQLGIAYPSIGYGATEACPGLTHLPPGTAPQESGDIGYWLKGVEHEDTENGFQFWGPNMCLARVIETNSHHFQLEFPKKILIRDELVKSGDRIIYKGRSDLKMNRGGEKFSLELIEEHLQKLLDIPVLACALPDSRLGEKLGLCLQSQSPTESLKKSCKDVVEKEFQWILQDREIYICEHFPTNENGKWNRRKVKDLLTSP